MRVTARVLLSATAGFALITPRVAMAAPRPAPLGSAVSTASYQAAFTPLPTKTFRGTGAATVKYSGSRRPMLLTYTYTLPVEDPHAYFQVTVLSSNGGGVGVSSNQEKHGTQAYFLPSYLKPVNGFKIDSAFSTWTLRVSDISTAPTLRDRTTVKGVNSAVFRMSPTLATANRVKLSFTGNGDFNLRPYIKGVPGNGLVNYYGKHIVTTTSLPRGTEYLVVIANGSWTIAR